MSNKIISEDHNIVISQISEDQNIASQHSTEIAVQFDNGRPYDRQRVVLETKFFMAQSAESMLEAGKRLVILKENEPHGEFISIIQNQLSLAPRTAQQVMQASLKYLSPKLESKAQALAHLGKTKLFELMVEDDESIIELTEGGTVAGLTLDDIDRMTSRELRAVLRETRENVEVQRRISAGKDEKINELSVKLEKKSRFKAPEPDEDGKQLRQEVSTIAFDAESTILGRLREAFTTLNKHYSDQILSQPSEFMAGLLCQIERAIHQVRDEFCLNASPTSNEEVPEWLNTPEPEIQRPDWMTEATPES